MSGMPYHEAKVRITAVYPSEDGKEKTRLTVFTPHNLTVNSAYPGGPINEVTITVRSDQLPNHLKNEKPTTPEYKIVSALNAGPWLALMQWIDWLFEQDEPDHRLIRGLQMMLATFRFPDPYFHSTKHYGHYQWVDNLWYKIRTPEMDDIQYAAMGSAYEDSDAINSVSHFVELDLRPAMISRAALPHQVALRLVGKGATFRCQANTSSEVITFITEMPVHKSLEEAYKAAAYAYADEYGV